MESEEEFEQINIMPKNKNDIYYELKIYFN